MILRFARLGLAVAVALTLTACNRSSGLEAPAVVLDAETAALLPEDDGSQIVVTYGSELLGSLDGCGCMGNPRVGGLPYRVGLTEGFRQARSGVGVVQLDAGFSMASITNASGKEVSDFVIQDEWIVTSLDRLDFDAANLTEHDLPFLARYLDASAYEAAVAKQPVLGRFVSANLEPARAGLVAPPAYVVRTVQSSRLAAGTIRMAVVGVTQPNPELESRYGFRTTDPKTAAAQAIARAKAESDVVVVLAYMPARQGAALATALGSAADVVIVANSLSGDAAPSLESAPRVTYSWYKTQKLGLLQLRFEGSTLVSATNTYIKLDDPLPRDPIVEDLAEKAKQALRQSKEQRFAEGARSSNTPAE